MADKFEKTPSSVTLVPELAKCLKKYTAEIVKALDDLTFRTAEDMRREIASNSPRRTGKYRRGWAIQKGRSYFTAMATVYNKNYRLPHLLEGSHRVVSHKKDTYIYAQPHRHIRPAEEKYVAKYIKEIERIMENA